MGITLATLVDELMFSAAKLSRRHSRLRALRLTHTTYVKHYQYIHQHNRSLPMSIAPISILQPLTKDAARYILAYTNGMSGK